MAVQRVSHSGKSSLLTRSKATLGKARRGVFRHSRFFVLEREIAGPITPGETLIPVTWRKGTRADIETFNEANLNYDALRRKYAFEAFDEGAEFVTGVHEGEIVHAGWVSYKSIVFPGFTLNLGPAWAYFYDTRTVERFQGNRLQGAGIRKRMEIAREKGATLAVNCVNVTNGTSKRNYEREGFQVIAQLQTWRVLKKWHIVRAPGWLQPYLLGTGGKPS